MFDHLDAGSVVLREVGKSLVTGRTGGRSATAATVENKAKVDVSIGD